MDGTSTSLKRAELFIKGTPDGLNRLSTLIESGTSDQVLKEISSIESIEPVTPALRRKNVEPADLLRRSPRGRRGFITRVRLFDLGGEREQPALVEDFEDVCRQRKIRLIPGGYRYNACFWHPIYQQQRHSGRSWNKLCDAACFADACANLSSDNADAESRSGARNIDPSCSRSPYGGPGPRRRRELLWLWLTGATSVLP